MSDPDDAPRGHIIVLDPALPEADREAILRYVADSRDIVGAYVGYPGFILVLTALSAPDLRRKLIVFTREIRFFVAAIDLGAVDGYMPKSLFDWAAKHRPPPPPLPARKRRNLN